MDDTGALMKDGISGLYYPATPNQNSRYLKHNEEVFGYEKVMNQWDFVLSVLPWTFMKKKLLGLTDELVGVVVSLNGSPKYDPRVIENNTIVKKPLVSAAFFLREVKIFIRLLLLCIAKLFSTN